jgi:hypothetical protein
VGSPNLLPNGCNGLLEDKVGLQKELHFNDCLCGLVVRVAGYRSRRPGSIPAATRFSENGVHSTLQAQLRSYLKGKAALA